MVETAPHVVMLTQPLTVTRASTATTARALELDPKSKVTAEKLQKLRKGDND